MRIASVADAATSSVATIASKAPPNCLRRRARQEVRGRRMGCMALLSTSSSRGLARAQIRPLHDRHHRWPKHDVIKIGSRVFGVIGLNVEIGGGGGTGGQGVEVDVFQWAWARPVGGAQVHPIGREAPYPVGTLADQHVGGTRHAGA